MQVATISAHNDSTIGETVAEALEKVGTEGTTTVEEAKGLRPRSKSWKACGSTAAISPRISLPIPRR